MDGTEVRRSLQEAVHAVRQTRVLRQRQVPVLAFPERVDVVSRHRHVVERHVDVLAFVAGCGVVARFDTLNPVRLVASQPDEGDVLHAPLAEPCLVAEFLALERLVLERPPFRVEVLVALFRADVRPAPGVGPFLQEDVLRHAALIPPMPPVGRTGVDARAVAMVAQARDCRIRGQPVLEEVAGDVELEVLRADAVELVRDVARPREQLLVHLPSPVESLVVRGRLRPVVDESVGRQPGPLALSGVLVRLELDLEERDLVAARGAHAITNEPVGIRMLGGGVVEDDDVASGRVEQPILQQSEQQHAT